MLNARLLRRYLGVTAALALFVLAALGATAWNVAEVRADPDGAAAEAVAETVGLIRAKTAEVMEGLYEEGARLAASPAIRRALADSAAALPVRSVPVLERVEGERALGQSVEVYRSDGALAAWDGFTAPFGPAARLGIPDTLRSGVVLDGPGRRLLVVWQPVWVDGRHVGAVRVLQQAQVEVPVRNQYLSDYDLSDAWRGEAALPFAVAFTGRLRVFSGDPARLVGPGGATLGWVAVPTPTVQTLVARAEGRGRHVVAFGLVLLGG